MGKLIGIFIFSYLVFQTIVWASYPNQWWKVFPKEEAPEWEILPHEALPGEVILSKRTELGVFSNLALAPFELDGIKYASIEGLWQGMKYPDPLNIPDDIRLSIKQWPYTREQVYNLSGWEAKDAGKIANQIYLEHQLTWINYGKRLFIYTDGTEGSQFHLELITRAIRAKILQNQSLKELLVKTKGLVLRPDHQMKKDAPSSFYYYEILMRLREALR